PGVTRRATARQRRTTRAAACRLAYNPAVQERSQPTPSPATAREATDWFRAPTRREHWIAAALFVGFGLFFLLLFMVLVGWWFRWVILGLALISVVYALGHAADAKREKPYPAA